MGARGGRFECPYCASHDVSRLYVATIGLDSCECLSCGARWDEEAGGGTYRGRSDRASVVYRKTD